jgi:hypothetical protein
LQQYTTSSGNTPGRCVARSSARTGGGRRVARGRCRCQPTDGRHWPPNQLKKLRQGCEYGEMKTERLRGVHVALLPAMYAQQATDELAAHPGTSGDPVRLSVRSSSELSWDAERVQEEVLNIPPRPRREGGPIRTTRGISTTSRRPVNVPGMNKRELTHFSPATARLGGNFTQRLSNHLLQVPPLS